MHLMQTIAFSDPTVCVSVSLSAIRFHCGEMAEWIDVVFGVGTFASADSMQLLPNYLDTLFACNSLK